MKVLPDPPCSSDLASPEYHLFRSLQHFLDGKRYTNNKEIKKTNKQKTKKKQQQKKKPTKKTNKNKQKIH